MNTVLHFATSRVQRGTRTPELPSKLQRLWDFERGSIEELTHVVLRLEQMLRQVELKIEGMPFATPLLRQQIEGIRALIRSSRQRLLEPSPIEQLLRKTHRATPSQEDF